MQWSASLAPRRNDVVLAGVLLAVSQVEVWAYGAAGGSFAAALTLGLAAVAMTWRASHPIVTVAGVAVALTLCAAYAGQPFSATSVLTFLIAVFSVGAMANRRLSFGALVVGLVASAGAVDPFTLNNYLAITLSSVAVPWLLGYVWLRHRTAREEESRRRDAATDAVAAERLRLAQELHDVVSHNVGMIAVQAGAADVLIDKDPVASRESLRAIEGGAKQTLLELRRMLGLLRDDDPRPLTPHTSLAALPKLFEPVGRAGVQVALRSTGEPVPLAHEVEVTAYRIVQEALTNVVAHAGPCRVQVVLAYAADRLEVEVSDDGSATTGTSRGGYGLTGIRERVAALGGMVSAGPRDEGGFAVRASLPIVAR